MKDDAKIKVIAFYLPQFHEIPENNKWWGNGFTEWVNMKKAKPLFEGHYQPRVPLGGNYYDLSDTKVQEWQCKIAREYNVYGFCFYHYWFDGHLLLEKPVEHYLRDDKCDLPFCICWANEHWTNAWVSDKNSVLIEQRYGGEKEWREHFEYLLPFLKNSRYIKEDGKPLFVIYRPELIDCLNDMLDCWQNLAFENGLPGLIFLYQHVSFDNIQNRDDSRFKYAIEYQPGYAFRDMDSQLVRELKNFKTKIQLFFEKKFAMNLGVRQLISKAQGLKTFDYDEVWHTILKRIPPSDKYIPGALVDWDNTPRRGVAGTACLGASPEKFGRYFNQLLIRMRNIYHKEYVFVFAWNEWAEGGYLEPDEKYGYGYLEALKAAVDEVNGKD